MDTENRGSKGRRTPTQRAGAWNAVAHGWHDWIPLMHNWYSPATNLMLQLAQIERGDHVLDIAAGDCDQSIEAARRVGPKGRVLAIDLAREMLEIGARAAQEAGIHNIETRIMDAQNLDLPDASYDAAICRFGLMLLPDPTRALEGVNRVLKREARVSVVVYADNGAPEFGTAVSVVRGFLGLETASQSVKSLGTPEALRTTLEKGGFRDIETHPLRLPIHLDSARECVRYLQATSPTLADMLSQLSEHDRDKAWNEVEAALARYERNEGFVVEHRVIVAAGTVG